MYSSLLFILNLIFTPIVLQLIKATHVFVNYTACNISTHKSSLLETRQLHVITCDTRSGYKSINAMKVWNVTGYNLRLQGVIMTNVCYGKRWSGFITKPELYLDYIKSLPQTSSNGELVHILYMDSDTFWSINDLSILWDTYDCVRRGLHLVLSTEMSCWIGKYCERSDIVKWYSSSLPPSFSPFINSGVAMGTAFEVAKMLNFVITHSSSYMVTMPSGKVKFDDQYAITDYAVSARGSIALDFQQALFGSSAAIAARRDFMDRQPFVCRNASGDIVSGCFDFSQALSKRGFYLLESNCLLRRGFAAHLHLHTEMATLSPSPVLWHANGVGRRTILSYGEKAYLCYLRHRNMSNEAYMKLSAE